MTETREIPWKRISVEAAAIVASILFAFAIDAWWEERQDRNAEQDYLLTILADIDVVISEVERTIVRNEELNKSARHRVAALRGGDQLSDSTEAAMLAEIWISFRLRANLDSYADLMSSGGVMLIQSPSVRGALSKLRSEMDFEQEIFQIVVASHDMQRPLLHESLDSGKLTIVARVEEDAINNRQNYNDRKSDVREAAHEARGAVLSAISNSSN